jgi:hypothetical protein
MKKMTKKISWLAATVLFLAIMVTDARPAPSQTWTGTLIDTTCYFASPADTGNVHEGMENCGEACLRLGRPAGILTADKKFSILIAPSPDIAKYAGQAIRVTGQMKNGMILVEKFEVQQGTNWQAVRLSSIM